MEGNGNGQKLYKWKNIPGKKVTNTGSFNFVHLYVMFNDSDLILGTVLPYRYSDTLGLEDAVHTAILTLKESFEGQMTEDNIEIGICDKDGFKRLSPSEVKDYLAAIQ